jgi:hypothetical protein
MFLLQENWEIKNQTINELTPPHTLVFPIVEVDHSNLFHVDLKVSDTENMTGTIRLIVTDIDQAIELCKDDHVDDYSISLQSQRFQNLDGEYDISGLLKVFTATQKNGQFGYIYQLKNGKKYYDFMDAEEEKTARLECIYRHKKTTKKSQKKC